MVKAENILWKIFLSPPPKNLVEKPQIYLKLSRISLNRKHVTLKWLKISTKKKTDVSSAIIVLQNGTKLGDITVITQWNFDAREKIGKP